MKFLKYVLYTLGAILALVLIVAAFLPSISKVQRSVIINKPIEEVFAAVDDLNNYDYWSPWNKYEKEYKRTISKNPRGIGSKFSWDGDSVGAGSFERRLIIDNKSIESELIFTKPWDSKARDVVEFEKSASGTKVTWSNISHLDYPFGRIMGIFMDKMVGMDYQNGMDNLKKAMESGPMGRIYEISIIDNPAQNILCVSGQVKLGKDAISQKLGESFSKVSEFLTRNSISPVGAPVAVTASHGDKIWSYYAGFPVDDKIKKTSGDLMLYTIVKGKVLKLVYTGPYDKMVPAYIQLHKFMESNNLKADGLTREEYVSDPKKVAPDKLVTNIYIPVK